MQVQVITSNRAFLNFAVTSLLVTSSLLAGEPHVRQGEPASDPNTALTFKSPMIIETDLPAPAPDSSPRQWVTTSEFDRYLCDGVRVRELRTFVRLTRDRARVWVGVTTYTEPGHDKKVRVEIELFTLDGTIGHGTMDPIDAEESTTARTSLLIKVPRSKWSDDHPPKLRLSVFVVTG